MLGSGHVLSLYRQMLRQGRLLQYTDKPYFNQRVRAEFVKNRHLTDATEIEHSIMVGVISAVNL